VQDGFSQLDPLQRLVQRVHARLPLRLQHRHIVPLSELAHLIGIARDLRQRDDRPVPEALVPEPLFQQVHVRQVGQRPALLIVSDQIRPLDLRPSHIRRRLAPGPLPRRELRQGFVDLRNVGSVGHEGMKR